MIKDKTFTKRRRHFVSIGYGGGGTKTQFFNKKPKHAFDDVKELYFKEVLDRSKKTELHFTELTKQEQLEVRNRIRKQLIKQRQLYYSRFAFIFLVIACGLVYLYNL